jgi:hypothetical protein
MIRSLCSTENDEHILNENNFEFEIYYLIIPWASNNWIEWATSLFNKHSSFFAGFPNSAQYRKLPSGDIANKLEFL